MIYKKTIKTVLLLAFALGFGWSGALASGMGFYGQVGFGSSDWEVDGYNGSDVDLDASESMFGLGYLFDTNVARDALINYRVKLGYEYADINFDGISSSEATHMLHIDNILGFSPYRTKTLRFWVGPEVRVLYRWGDGSNLTKDLDGIGIGIGPVMGLNMHMSKNQSFSVSTGIRRSVFGGSWHSSGGNNNFTATDTTIYVNFAFLFRSLDDQYGAK
jgi:hypothetical protein